MPLVSQKRQITLPINQCKDAGIEPGDSVRIYTDNNGIISIIKQVPGITAGMFKGHKIDDIYTDEESLLSGMER